MLQKGADPRERVSAEEDTGTGPAETGTSRGRSVRGTAEEGAAAACDP